MCETNKEVINKIIGDTSSHGFAIGTMVKLIGCGLSTNTKQVRSIEDSILRFVHDNDMVLVPNKQCECPKCKVYLEPVNGDVKFVSKHAHYKKKCDYTRREYSDEATKIIVSLLSTDILTAREIEQETGIYIKTVRNIIGVLIKSKVVESPKKDTCNVTGMKTKTYKIFNKVKNKNKNKK